MKLSIKIPPAHLMKREQNNENSSYYRASCFKSYRELWEVVCKYRDPKSIRTMLDWGCGCGRLINMFLNLSEIPDIRGCGQAAGSDILPGFTLSVDEFFLR